jgi:ABC-type sugar transport system ATPase subunit
MAGVDISNLHKRLGTVQAVAGINLSIPDGTFVSVLGLSGCGKTTVLRLLAGLETPDSGRISIGERDVTELAPGTPRALA